MTSEGCGSTGSTKISMVPLLGHMLEANRTPSLASPGLTPSSARRFSGCTETMRGSPSASASRAALSTAPRAQPPPIQPATMVPSGRMIALAPAFAAVTETVRTTVARTKVSSAAFSRATRSITSTCAVIGVSSEFRQIGFKLGQAFERIGGRVEIDMRQCGLDARGNRCIALPRQHRIEPDDAAAAFCERRHLAAEQCSVAGLVAVGYDHDAGARMQHARGVPSVEGLQAFADPCAAARALRHDRQTIERAARILFLHRVRDVSEPGVEQERLGLAKLIEHAVDEAQEHGGVHAHRAGGIEQHDQAQRLLLALPLDQADRHPAMADIAVDRPSQVEPIAA